MKNNLPTIVITGASGFIGRYFIDNNKEQYYIFAIARRSSNEANVPIHPNIQWIQWDISNSAILENIINYLQNQGGADYFLHLAGYYDFDYKDRPEYSSTNVQGTKNVLKLAKMLRVKRFIFASSLAACKFPSKNDIINEKTKPDANFAYALSKKRGEEMVKEFSKYFNCSVVRFAAVFSDWCEYAPLYKFLSTWLTKKYDSKILAGNGSSAISYIHLHDLAKLINTIISKSRFLPSFDIYIASPDGCTTHRELFKMSTLVSFGREVKPFFLPKILAYPGIIFKRILGYIHITPMPFERCWMIKYIDLKLNIDSTYTQKVLGWEPTPRYHIMRRLLFLLINIKSHPNEWLLKNEEALHRVTQRTNLIIYEHLITLEEKILKFLFNYITSPERNLIFSNYQKMKPIELKSHISTIFNLLLASVRSGDRMLMLKYIDEIALERFASGFNAKEVCEKLKALDNIIMTELLSVKELKKMRQEIHDYIELSIQLAQDEMEDIFEELEQKLPYERIIKLPAPPDIEKRQKLILKLSTPYQVYSEDPKIEKYHTKLDKYSLYDMR